MNRITLLIFSFATLFCLSCVKEDMSEPVVEEDSAVWVFRGSTGMDGLTNEDSKVTVRKDDGTAKWTFLWQTNEQISVFRYNRDLKEDDAVLTDGTDSNHAVFVLKNNSETTSYEGDVIITYPTLGSAKTPYNSTDHVITGEIKTKQVRERSSWASHLCEYGFSYDRVRFSSGTPADFTLNHTASYVRFIFQNASRYEDYAITGVKLFCEGAALSGKVSVDVDDNSITYPETNDYVDVDLQRPMSLAVASTQQVWVVVIPGDFRRKDFYVILEMKKVEESDEEGYVTTYGTETITIPIKISSPVFKAQTVHTIYIPIDEVEEIAMKHLPWYDTREKSRDLLDAYAYGPQNTIMIEQQATSRKVTIDVRARGDFLSVERPAYYGLYLGSSEMATRRLFYLNDNTEAYNYGAGVFPVPEDYMVPVNIYDSGKQGRWTVLALYNEEKEVIWSYMLWRCLSDDLPSSVDYGNFQIMDRAIGANRSYSTEANAPATGSGSAESLGKIEISEARFQWGRKDPFMWSPFTSSGTNYETTTTQRYYIEDGKEGERISNSIARPGVIKNLNKEKVIYGDWLMSENSHRLWGWDSTTGKGHKTIYDPCPAGYRVPDLEVLEYLNNNSSRWEFYFLTYTSSDGGVQSKVRAQAQYQNSAWWENTSSPFNNGCVLAVPVSSQENGYDYWTYPGVLWANYGVTQWANNSQRSATNFASNAIYWSNQGVEDNETEQRANAFVCSYSSSGTDKVMSKEYKARVFAVRCQRFDAEEPEVK